MGVRVKTRAAHVGMVLVALVSSCRAADTSPPPPVRGVRHSVAFMADVHFENVYGDFKNARFSGIPTREGKNATIRTMYAQLTSTRLFNENYFAFRSALEDAYSRDVRLVALPGDYSDDAQPINIKGLADILREYQAKGMRFFLAPGNHDPNEPYDDEEAGKSDFLTREGKEQKVYATENSACKAGDPNVVCTKELMEQGYEKLITALGDFGFLPSQEDLYWETPFSQYREGQYTHEAAMLQGQPESRQFEICAEGEGGRYKADGEARLGRAYTRCTRIIDSSYLVEPVKDLWLLSIDANVFIPNGNFNPSNAKAFKGFDGAGNAGWNKVLTHKKHLLEWIQSVAERARTQGKQLLAFSHYPTMDFYANQTQAMKAVFKPGAFQTARVPDVATTAALAATGLRLHVGGHMHFNGTNDYQDEAGRYLVNVQAPSLAVYGAAYKLITSQDENTLDVQTVALNSVARHDELFPLYRTESDYLRNSTASGDVSRRWNPAILESRSYGEFTHSYFGELSRLRFMDEYWPCEMKEAATSLDARQMLILSQLRTRVTLAQLKDIPGIVPLSASCAAMDTTSRASVEASQLRADWVEATARADALARAAGLKLEDFARVSAYEFHGDFHRTVYAGELALRDMGAERVRQYTLLMDAFPESPEPILKMGDKPSDQNTVPALFQNQFKQVFAIFRELGSAKPSDHFTVDFAARKIRSANDSALSFH